ncbi:MAG: sulfurtransferase TusA family protein [Nitrospirae bacterium]|nr:sulfurtransferase TusA family protein [Nitrospirota bacterium]
MNADKSLDCRGMVCPRPVLETNKTVRAMEIGQVLEVLATDPASSPDLKAWASRTGNEILESVKENDIFKFYIKRVK